MWHKISLKVSLKKRRVIVSKEVPADMPETLRKEMESRARTQRVSERTGRLLVGPRLAESMQNSYSDLSGTV